MCVEQGEPVVYLVVTGKVCKGEGSRMNVLECLELISVLGNSRRATVHLIPSLDQGRDQGAIRH